MSSSEYKPDRVQPELTALDLYLLLKESYQDRKSPPAELSAFAEVCPSESSWWLVHETKGSGPPHHKHHKSMTLECVLFEGERDAIRLDLIDWAACSYWADLSTPATRDTFLKGLVLASGVIPAPRVALVHFPDRGWGIQSGDDFVRCPDPHPLLSGDARDDEVIIYWVRRIVVQ